MRKFDVFAICTILVILMMTVINYAQDSYKTIFFTKDVSAVIDLDETNKFNISQSLKENFEDAVIN